MGDQLLLLIHGLTGTGRVWDGVQRLAADRWQGPVLAPDLAGHGRAPRLASYNYATYAEQIASQISAEYRQLPVVIVGHSLGGVVGFTIASGHGLSTKGVVGIGMKIQWTDDEIAGIEKIASRPVDYFDTEAEAVGRYLKVSGLAGLIDDQQPATKAGVVQEGDRWRIATDPAAYTVTRPDMAALTADRDYPMILACGTEDQMAPVDQLGPKHLDIRTLDGVGHNAHVEDPAQLWALIAAVV